MATWRTTSVLADASAHATWRATQVYALGTVGPQWRATYVAATLDNVNGTWRATSMAVEVQSSLQGPIADASNSQTVAAPSELVRLDGSASFGQGGAITTYTWRPVSASDGGTIPTLSSTSALKPTFRARGKSSSVQYVYGLTVTDANSIVSNEDFVTVVISPADLAFATSSGWQPCGILAAAADSSGWF